MEFADDDFDIDAEVVFIAENFDDPSTRTLSCGGLPFGDFDIDDYAFEILPFGAAGSLFAKNSVQTFLLFRQITRCLRFRIFHPCGNDDFLGDLLVDGPYVVATWAVVEDADDRRMGAGNRPDDASFGAAVGADRAHLDQHEIAVHGESHGWRRDENVSGEARFEGCMKRSGIRSDEAEAVAMHA